VAPQEEEGNQEIMCRKAVNLEETISKAREGSKNTTSAKETKTEMEEREGQETAKEVTTKRTTTEIWIER